MEPAKDQAQSRRRKGKDVAHAEDRIVKLELPGGEIVPKGGRPFNPAQFGALAVKGFAKLYHTQMLSDLTLLVGEEKLKVHRAVLCVWSDTFRAMLESHDRWAESGLSELNVDIEPTDYQSFKQMISYMYTGDTNFINGKNIVSLLSLANYYGVLSLKEICGEILGSIISEETLLYLLDVCDRYACHSLEAKCGEYLAENFQQMLESGRLAVLEPSIWAEMIRSDELKISSEEKLFEEVLNYASQFKEDKQRWRSVLEQLLPHVRFPFFSGKSLVEVVEANEELREIPLVHELLHEAFKFKAFPAGVNNERTKPRKGFSFDRNKCPAAITISEDGLRASMPTLGGWHNVKTSQPLVPGNNYIEFHFESGVNIMVGVVAGDCASTGYAGQYQNGWTYYTNGQIYHGGTTVTNGQAWNPGDRVGVLMNFDNGSLRFFRNGSFTAAVTGVPTTGETLYPIVCFSAAGSSLSVKPNSPPPEVAPNARPRKYASDSESEESSYSSDY